MFKRKKNEKGEELENFIDVFLRNYLNIPAFKALIKLGLYFFVIVIIIAVTSFLDIFTSFYLLPFLVFILIKGVFFLYRRPSCGVIFFVGLLGNIREGIFFFKIRHEAELLINADGLNDAACKKNQAIGNVQFGQHVQNSL